MMKSATAAVVTPDANEVLSKAFLRACHRLGLPQKNQARLLGLSAASMSRLSRGTRSIDVESKEGELALLFVRLFRSLDALTGGDEAKSRGWLHARNDHLGGVPAELVCEVRGLVHVVEYLDAMRGRL